MADFPIYRLVKGSTLSFTEMDDNLRWLSANMSASVVTITGSTYVAGNLNVSNGITGSLFGTSSWAVSASWAPSSPAVTTISSYIATGSITASVSNTDISASFRVTSGSNTLLNVTRDGFVWIGNGAFSNQGYQLDVQGTARISQALKLFSGGTAPFNNYPLNAYASSGGIASFEYATNGFIQFVRAGFTAAIIRSSYAETYDLVINAGNSGTFLGMCLRPDGTGIKIGGDPTTITHINSAQLNIESTTRGVLLPRMTAPQRVAIVTPAQGLLVYDTGSITEGLWYYNSGSNPGWQEVLTNSGSQSISGSLTATNFTGSLQGTSSWAVSASWAPSAGGGTTLNGSGYVSMSGTTVSYVSAIPNSSLANSSITIQGSSTALGGSVNVINGTGFVKSSGTSITYDNNTYYSASNPNGYTSNAGTITSITVSPGTGMSGGGTLTGAGGTLTLTNSAPDQTVVLNSGTGISVTGTYPNFTISSTGTTVSSFISTGSVSASVNTDVTASFKVTSGSRTLFTLTNDGRAVIGTPGEFIDYRLEVSGAIKANSNIIVDLNSNFESAFYGSGQFLSGVTDQPILYLSSTWDTTAAARGIEYRVTNIASSGSSKLLNLFVDNVSMFNVSRLGNVGVGLINPQTKIEVYNQSDDEHFSAVGSAPSLNLLDANINAAIVGTVGLVTNVDNFIQDTVPGDLCISTRGSTNAAAYIIFGSGSTMTAYISGSGDMYIKGTLTQGSTRNIKQNIAPINNALSTVIEMQGVTYDKKDGSATNEPGFIAEDLYTILPSLVSLNKNGDPYGVKYTNLTAYLVEAIKELKIEIDILKNK